MTRKVSVSALRSRRVRAAVELPKAKIMGIERFISGRRVVVTGAVGTVGRALVSRLLTLGPAEIRLFDNNESELFFAAEALTGSPVRAILGDIRDRQKLEEAFAGVHIVFSAAALKHVPLCEHHPLEAVQTNILGIQNVIQAALATRVERVIQMSSDKAVNPTNVMGASKLMGEKLINAANVVGQESGQIFSSVRFGNVLGSRGSVVPLFSEQIRRGGPITLTDPGMTRFVMTLDDAVQLVIDAAEFAKGGEVLVCKMAVIRIIDLAHVMVEELARSFGRAQSAIEIRTVGLRPGEKMYEELMNAEEMRRSIELDRYFAILPALSDIYAYRYDYLGVRSERVSAPYNSHNEPAMTREALRAYLRESGLLSPGGA